MSVGMASFGGRSEELDPIGVARAATAMIWAQRGRIWPYVLLLAAVSAGIRAVGWRYGLPVEDGYSFHDHESLAEFARHGAWRCGTAVVSGLFTAMTLRALMGYAAPAWRPDRGLLGFTAIYLAASAAPLVIFLPVVLAWVSNGAAAIALVVAGALGGVCALVALAYFCLRLVIWPVGVAVGDTQMTAARAWRDMVGARVAWLFAGILLMLPLILGSALAGAIIMGALGGPTIMDFDGGHRFGGGPWEAPLHAVAVVLWLAVGAAIYRLRTERDAA